MDAILASVDSWILALGLGILMLAGWEFGLWRGRRMPPERRSDIDATFSGASMALLGLLLGFTFSMSLTKHEQRRQMVITDSNAIGDFATCAALLPEPTRSKLRAIIRDYVQHRLDARKRDDSEAEQRAFFSEIRTKHAAMTEAVDQAVQKGTPVTVPLVSTLNDLTSSHAARLAAIRDRLPASIVLLLAFAAVITMVLVGIQQGAAGHRQTVTTIAFVILVALVILAILDLNQPRRGFITVSNEPMEMLMQEL
jgi:hypothetical protein